MGKKESSGSGSSGSVKIGRFKEKPVFFETGLRVAIGSDGTLRMRVGIDVLDVMGVVMHHSMPAEQRPRYEVVCVEDPQNGSLPLTLEQSDSGYLMRAPTNGRCGSVQVHVRRFPPAYRDWIMANLERDHLQFRKQDVEIRPNGITFDLMKGVRGSKFRGNTRKTKDEMRNG